MPKFEITSPDGQRYEVNAPEGATEQDAIAYVQQNLAPKASQPTVTRGQSIIQGLRDPVDAGAQLLTNVLPESVVQAGNKLNNVIAQNTGLLAPIPAGGVNQMVSENEAAYQASRGNQGGIDWWRLAGNVASPVNLAIASKIPQGATAAQRLAAGAAGGAGLNVVTQPVVGAESPAVSFGEEKAKQAGIGAAGGAVGQALVSGVSRAISPEASRNVQLQALRAQGVNPTIGQTLGGGFARAEEKLASVPIVGDIIAGARTKANMQFERAAYNRALQPIGQKLPIQVKGRDALTFTEQALKNNYDDVLNRIGAITPDNEFNSKLSQLESMVNSAKIPQANKDKFSFLVSKLESSVDQNGVMTSQAYKQLESALTSDVKRLAGSQDVYDDTVAQAGKQLVSNLTTMLERQSGPLAKDLKATNQAWANFKRIQRAASSVGAQDGSFTPAQLQTAVKGLDKTKDKAAFARGDALLQDLSDAGKSVLGNTVPNSGTADRLLLGGSAIGAYLEPTVGLPILGAASLYTQPAQRALNALVTNRPQFAEPAAQAVRQSGNYLLPGFGAAGLGLLNQ